MRLFLLDVRARLLPLSTPRILPADDATCFLCSEVVQGPMGSPLVHFSPVLGSAPGSRTQLNSKVAARVLEGVRYNPGPRECILRDNPEPRTNTEPNQHQSTATSLDQHSTKCAERLSNARGVCTSRTTYQEGLKMRTASLIELRG